MKQEKKGVRKTVMAGLIASMLTVSFAMVGCGNNAASTTHPQEPANNQTETPAVTYRTVERNGDSFQVNSEWIEKELSERATAYLPDDPAAENNGPFILVMEADIPNLVNLEPSAQLEMMKLNLQESENENGDVEMYANYEEGMLGSHPLLMADGESYRNGKLVSVYKTLFFCTSSRFVGIRFTVNPEEYDIYKDEIESFVASLKEAKHETPTTGSSSASAGSSSASTSNSSTSASSSSSSGSTASTASTASRETTSQRNAVKQAERYLKVIAFSRQGLIEQLEFEGYSTEDAEYAVDHIRVDWNEQAAKKAQSYLDTMPFSRQGLIEQLEFEGFTHEQAVFGVDSVGL